MSEKLDGIDLNSNDISAVGNRVVDGSGNETLIENPSDRGGCTVAGNLEVEFGNSVHDERINMASDVDKTFNSASVDLNAYGAVGCCNGRGEEEKSVGPMGFDVSRTFNGLSGGNAGGEAKGVNDTAIDAKMERDDGLGKICGSDGMPHCDGDGTGISLVVDLNGQANGGTRMEPCLEEASVPVVVGPAGNIPYINKRDLNGDQYRELNEEVRGVPMEKANAESEKAVASSPTIINEDYRKEKEGEFYVSDLVWGKVRSHPWWPGQIFEPTAASKKAMKYFKKDSYLIAYFGDQTFAWNEESKIKPFRMHFHEMAKQSSSEVFSRAVDSALDEVSRRVEFGLSCPCLPEEVRSRVISQVVANAGIREESSRRIGGDDMSSVLSFIPAELIENLKALAVAPCSGIDRLKFVIAKAQLLSFSRWKGFVELPAFEEIDDLLEDELEWPKMEEEKNLDKQMEKDLKDSKSSIHILSESGKSSRKRRYHFGYDDRPNKKSILISGSSSSVSKDENESEGRAGRKKRKAVGSEYSNSKVKQKKRCFSPQSSDKKSQLPSNFLKIREGIREAAKKIGECTPVVKSPESTFQRKEGKHAEKSSTEKSGGKLMEVQCPPHEMLSKLCLAAVCPLKKYDSLGSMVNFLCDFRNSNCQESTTQDNTNSPQGHNTRNSLNSGMVEFEGIEDSYWTDRIIQSNSEEPIAFEHEVQVDKDASNAEREVGADTNINADNKQENNAVFVQSAAAHPSGGLVDETPREEYSPTAFILNFSDLDSIPSITNLNQIFSRYGPLNESETEILDKSKRAKVIFKRRSDAETAFSSSGKFGIFGPSLISYRLHYSPSPRKATRASRGNRKNAKSLEGDAR